MSSGAKKQGEPTIVDAIACEQDQPNRAATGTATCLFLLFEEELA
jgi:hypothetical protein